jgi:tRNA threonylcarbamoyl adenosine modification protein YeaZ
MTKLNDKMRASISNKGIAPFSSAEIILAIETGVASGSLSLFINKKEVDFWIGEGTVSKAEDILEAIDTILSRNSINIKSITLLASSIGPGSLTGLRIGSAIAKGIRKAAGCEIKNVSVLEAMIEQDLFEIKTIAAAVPMGKTKISWQIFEKGINGNFKQIGNKTPYIEEIEFFAANIKNIDADCLFVHQNVYENIMPAQTGNRLNRNENFKLINAGTNLAKLVGQKVGNILKATR